MRLQPHRQCTTINLCVGNQIRTKSSNQTHDSFFAQSIRTTPQAKHVLDKISRGAPP